MSRQIRPLSRSLRALNLQRRCQSTEPSPTTTPEEQQDIRSPNDHAQILSYIKSQDSLALSTTKNHLSTLTSTTLRMQSLISSIGPSASQIHLLPGTIPPYTPSFWNSISSAFSHATTTLLSKAQRIESNLTDLEIINYPADVDGSGTQAQKDREEMEGLTRTEQGNALWDLGNAEEAHRKRLNVALKRFEDDVSAFVGEVRKTAVPVFQVRTTMTGKRASLGENVRREQKRGVGAGGDAVGWGNKATKIEAKGEGERRTGNPFQIRTLGSDSPLENSDVRVRQSGGISETVMSAHSERTPAPATEDAHQAKSDAAAKEHTAPKPSDATSREEKSTKPTDIEALQAQLEVGMNV